MNGNKPVRVFRAGAIKASVFENSAFVKGVKSTIFNVIVSIQNVETMIFSPNCQIIVAWNYH